ncbi:MAG: stalk domain-containing protein [Armatimonadota bacterium]
MKTTNRFGVMAMLAAGLVLLTMTSGMAAIQVELNGDPVALSVAPITVVNRTMVPMRSIFEALGAGVQWTESTQTVKATRGATNVELTIGETDATVNGYSVALDVPAMIHRGSTMVPLRFVSESLGADVRWSGATQTVSIFTDGTPYTDHIASMHPVAIPSATVIPVSLDTPLGSLASEVGDGFSVTVVSTLNGDAEFPRGTKLVGNVVGVQKANGSKPGVLDLTFREVWLPDGTKTTIDGSLISLDDKAVTRSEDGRLRATVRRTGDDRLKMIGIGAGAGLLIGKLLDQNLIVGGLLGAAAGYFYNEYTTDKVRATDVLVAPGTVFGVRMDRDVTFGASEAFVAARAAYVSAG